MGKVVVNKQGKDGSEWQVLYYIGKGRQKMLAFVEELDGSDPASASFKIAARLEELRGHVKPTRFTPAS